MKVVRFLVAAAVGLGSLLVTGAPAYAEVLHDDVTPGTFSAPSKDGDMKVYHLATISFEVASGQRTYVNGNLTFANADIPTLVDASVSCAVGASTAGSVVHNENIGPDRQPSVAISARMLAAAPYAGTMYCRLYAWVSSLRSTPSTFSVTRGELEVGRRSVPGGIQAASTNQVTTIGNPVWTPVIPGSASAGSVTGLWQPPAGTSALTVFGDLSLTKCRTGDAYGCPPTSSTTDTKVVTTLYVTQFNSDGSVCGTPATYSTTLTISDARRHDVAYTNLPSVPVATGGLCVPKFSIYLKSQVTSGGAAVTHGRATAGEMGVLFVLPT
ncbi:hypothetical protein [Flindersiella endophytica]